MGTAALILVAAMVAASAMAEGELLAPQEKFRVARLKTSAVLTDKSFGVVTGDGFWVIKFYAPWCGHCMKLEPEWVRFASKLDPELGISVGEVNCVQQNRLENAFGIQGYPTILMYHDRQVWAYSGGRSADQLLAFFKENPPKTWLSKPLLLQISEDSPFLELLAPAERGLKQNDNQKEEVVTPGDVELAIKALPVRLSLISLAQTVKQGSWIVKACSTFTEDCQRFVPVWLDAIANIKAKFGNDIRFGEIEANEEFMHQYSIKDLPSILLFRDGQMFRYAKDMTDLVSYLQNDWPDDIPDALPSLKTHPTDLSPWTFVIRLIVILAGIGGIAYIVNALIAWSNKSKSL